MQINSRSHLLNRNSIGILLGFLDEFRLESSNGVGVVSEFFKNSDAVCFSDKIPTEEVEVDTKIKFDGL
jgi:hypothetical protein